MISNVKFLLSLFTILIGFASNINAQQAIPDTLFLDDGSILVCEILDQKKSRVVNFRMLATGEHKSVKKSRIDRIVKDGVELQYPFIRIDSIFVEPKYFIEGSLSAMFSKDKVGNGLELSFFTKQKPWLNLGINISFDRYRDSDRRSSFHLTTINVAYRAYLLTGKFKPYVGINAGYSIAANSNFSFFNPDFVSENGYHINPNLGILFFVKPRIAYSFGLGFKFQDARFEGEFDQEFVEFDGVFRRFQIKVGMSFSL